jgi:hypothetical protein
MGHAAASPASFESFYSSMNELESAEVGPTTSMTILLLNDGWAAKIDLEDGLGWAYLFCGALFAS